MSLSSTKLIYFWLLVFLFSSYAIANSENLPIETFRCWLNLIHLTQSGEGWLCREWIKDPSADKKQNVEHNLNELKNRRLLWLITVVQKYCKVNTKLKPELRNTKLCYYDEDMNMIQGRYKWEPMKDKTWAEPELNLTRYGQRNANNLTLNKGIQRS